MILVGDVGGTKVNLALVEKNKTIELTKEEFFLTANFSSLEELLQEFQKKHGEKIDSICLGIAGPVINEKAKITNLPWIVTKDRLKELLQCKNVLLLNDLVALAYGIFVLKEKDFFVLQRGVVTPGNVALIAAGTGLGVAGLLHHGKEFFPFSSEAGHGDFAPTNQQEWEFFLELQRKYGHVSCERVLSRSGLVEMLIFLQKKGGKTTFRPQDFQDPKISLRMIEKAVKKEDDLCQEALSWFCSIYGREAGNVALQFFSLQGVYIGGGIAPSILSFLQQKEFLTAFSDKGRFSSLLQCIPIKVILNEKAPLLGAAYCAIKNLEK